MYFHHMTFILLERVKISYLHNNRKMGVCPITPLSLFYPCLSLLCPWLSLFYPCLYLFCPGLYLFCPCLLLFEKRAFRKSGGKFYKQQHFQTSRKTCEDKDFSDMTLVRKDCHYIESDEVILSARHNMVRGIERIKAVIKIIRVFRGSLAGRTRRIYCDEGQQA